MICHETINWEGCRRARLLACAAAVGIRGAGAGAPRRLTGAVLPRDPAGSIGDLVEGTGPPDFGLQGARHGRGRRDLRSRCPAAARGCRPRRACRSRGGTRHWSRRAIRLAEWAIAVLYNGLGRYRAALAAAQRASEGEDLGLFGWALVELVQLVEAGAPSGAPPTPPPALPPPPPPTPPP